MKPSKRLNKLIVAFEHEEKDKFVRLSGLGTKEKKKLNNKLQRDWFFAWDYIEGLYSHLTEVEKYQFALENLESAKTYESFLFACGRGDNDLLGYPLYCDLYDDNTVSVHGTGSKIDYFIHLQSGELEEYTKKIRRIYQENDFPSWLDLKGAFLDDYLFFHLRELIVKKFRTVVKEIEGSKKS